MLRVGEAPAQADRHTSEEYSSGLFSLSFANLPTDLCEHTDGAGEGERSPPPQLWHVQVCVDRSDLERDRHRERRTQTQRTNPEPKRSPPGYDLLFLH